MKNVLENRNHRRDAEPVEEQNWILPAVNVMESPNAYVIEADMPGVTRQGLEVTLEEHTLTLTGRRESGRPAGNALYMESKPAGFRRSFEIEPTIDGGKISARLEQGLLTVHLPKAERLQPRKIAVTD